MTEKNYESNPSDTLIAHAYPDLKLVNN